MNCSRRTFLAGGLAFLPLPSAFAQTGHDHHGGLYERLQQPGRIDKPELASAQIRLIPSAPSAVSCDDLVWHHTDGYRMFGRKRLACSFCGKREAEVAKLVAGPKVYICDRCVTLASQIMAGSPGDEPRRRPDAERGGEIAGRTENLKTSCSGEET